MLFARLSRLKNVTLSDKIHWFVDATGAHIKIINLILWFLYCHSDDSLTSTILTFNSLKQICITNFPHFSLYLKKCIQIIQRCQLFPRKRAGAREWMPLFYVIQCCDIMCQENIIPTQLLTMVLKCASDKFRLLAHAD